MTTARRLIPALLLCVLALSPSLRAQAHSRPPVRVSGGVMAGLIISKVDPVYPPEAKEQHITGAVVLAATISEEGTVAGLTVVSGPASLRDSALTAVRQWTYKPYLLNGEPRSVQTVVTVNFSLSQ